MRAILAFLAMTFSLFSFSQAGFPPDYFDAYSSFHDHPSYKHYSRPKKATIVQDLLRHSHYNNTTHQVSFDPQLAAKLAEHDNWNSYLKDPKSKPGELKTGEISTLRNYDQASFSEIKFTPGSVLCTSLYPFEKQYALNGIKIFINSNFVTKMGGKRLKYYGNNQPLNDFFAEYYYTLFQDKIRKVTISVPQGLYESSTNKAYTTRTFYHAIRLMKDNNDLRATLLANSRLTTSTTDATHPITTALIMTIEGGQVLYDTISSNKKVIKDPLSISDAVRQELLNSVKKIKTLGHRLFFITPAHFTQNHIVGFAKTIDRDIENFQHRIPALMAGAPFIRNFMVVKGYDGWNMTRNIGYDIALAFLDPNNTYFKKPTYIDVKHMDVKSRIQYYYHRRHWADSMKIPIPIIASHSAISGEKQAMAAATGLRPFYDQYPESEDPAKFYKSKIMDSAMWIQIMEGSYNKNMDAFDAEEKNMYTPLDFQNPPRTDAYYPFTGYDPDKDPATGWFYPWSLNLFDEEIIEINKSDGIIGLLLDPRQLGAFAPNYKKFESFSRLGFQARYATLTEKEKIDFQLETKDITELEYLKAEPFLRNVFYIVQLILQQQDAESGTAGYAWYRKDNLKAIKDPWKMISLGTDFDGLIDPIDFAPTSSYLPLAHRKMILFAYWFAIIHKDEFKDPTTGGQLINSIAESTTYMKQIFYQNAVDFILQYF